MNDTGKGNDSIANTTQWSVQSNFQQGAVSFGDRTYPVASVPTGSPLLGLDWIRPANDSKSYTTSPVATFVTGGTFLYLAIDDRHNGTTGRPAFLDAAFTDQGFDITLLEGATTYPCSVWGKAVTPGTTVTLPAVKNTAASMYLTIVR